MATKMVSEEAGQVQALVDYVAATLPLEKLDTVLEILGREEWDRLPYGRRGYLHALVKGGMQIHYAGEPTRNKEGEETLHLSIPGQSCRTLEALEVITHQGGALPWERFIGLLLEHGATFRRLDFAFDDKTGRLYPRMLAAVKADHLTTRWKKGKGHTEYEFGGGGKETDEGLSFGQRASPAYLRVYDKALEQRQKGKPYEGECSRLEIEFKGNKAAAVAKRIASEGSLAFVVGIIKGLVDFKTPGTSPRKTRWETADWWAAFLGHCQKVRLTVDPVFRTIEQVERWIQRQVAPSLALLFTHYRGEWDKLEAIINQGRYRWKDRHRLILKLAEAART